MKTPITIDDLVNKTQLTNEAKLNIYKAYNLAYQLHKDQKRDNGEKYITHPLNVAYIIAELGGDETTIIASLLHDTLEDTSLTKQEIENIFGKEIAEIVDGVTKLDKINFLTKEEKDLENRRKLVKAITKDVRVIILKLADRLHNMRTLDFKNKIKQIENAKETINFFVPFANELGLTSIEKELINLANKYLENSIEQTKDNVYQSSWNEITTDNNSDLIETLKNIDINNTYIPKHIKKLNSIKR